MQEVFLLHSLATVSSFFFVPTMWYFVTSRNDYAQTDRVKPRSKRPATFFLRRHESHVERHLRTTKDTSTTHQQNEDHPPLRLIIHNHQSTEEKGKDKSSHIQGSDSAIRQHLKMVDLPLSVIL